MITGDKALGMTEAISQVFPDAKYQRCTVHFIGMCFLLFQSRREREACNPEPALWNFQCRQQKQCPRQIFMMLKPAAVLRNARGLAFEIYNHASADIIRGVLEVLLHAE